MKKFKSITIFLFICLASTMYGCSSKDTGSDSIIDSSTISESSPDVSEINDVNENETSPTSIASESESGTVNSENDADKSIIIDYNIKTDNIEERQFDSVGEVELNRPSSLKGTEVFLGWEEQDTIAKICDNSYSTNETVSLTVETTNIADTENAIFNDTIYSSDKSDQIEIPIIIGGYTNFSILDLEVSYDTELFSFDSFTYTDDDAVCNCTDDEKIIISFTSTSNITADVNLCTVKLKRKSSQKAETALKYYVKDIAAWNEDSSDYTDVTYEIVNGKIVMY